MPATPRRPSVYYLLLNLRMGGQVSSIVALQDALAARGAQTRFLLPDSVRAPEKHALQAYGGQPVVSRLRQLWRLIASLRDIAGDSAAVLHVVLPSPAFSGLVRMLPFPARRILVQYEGPCTRLDAEHLRVFRDDPCLMAPRLVLNNAVWAPLGRATACSHLATHPCIATQLRRAGFERVYEVPNLGSLSPALDGVAPSLPPALEHETWCGYIGHAHRVKGVDDLVVAFASAAATRRDLRLLLALSEDGNAARVRRLVSERGLGARVHLAGLIDISEALRRLDALVLPYRSTITTTLYPSLLLEADLARCPLIVSDLPEIVPALNSSHGCLQMFRPGEPDSLAAALRRVQSRSSCTTRLLQLPDEAERTTRLEQIYAELVRCGTAPRTHCSSHNGGSA